MNHGRGRGSQPGEMPNLGGHAPPRLRSAALALAPISLRQHLGHRMQLQLRMRRTEEEPGTHSLGGNGPLAARSSGRRIWMVL
jgi:hypothetical protein